MKKLLTVSLVERDGIKQLDWQTDQAETADLDQLISILGQFRATLEPAFPAMTPEAGGMLPVLSDPRWVAIPTADDSLCLAIRHHGFGWLGYQFAPESEATLLNLLQTRQAKQPEHSGPVH